MKRILWIITGSILFWASATAQLSPGALSQPHQFLDGPKHCNQCHTPKKGVDRQKCLECHTLLDERIRQGKGLHARPGYEACERCHVEHQGRDADLIWWGKEGIQGFDHRQTGYPLRGAHQKITDCRKCHNPNNMNNPLPLQQAKKDLSRTYLGLSTTCTPCHEDIHQGQFEPRSCETCHTQDRWKPASKFDHSKTRFQLRGKHASVRCSQCHPRRKGVVQFSGIQFHHCTDCHTDPHQGQLDSQCIQCHTPKGWHQILRPFDHGKTKFPLIGAHQRVACGGCHPPGRPKRETPMHCSGCHEDLHKGQFVGLSCDRCHTSDTFKIPKFSVEQHDSTTFPLQGAHRAVPCSKCHKPVDPALFSELTGLPRPDTTTVVFKFRNQNCETCHPDPHAEEFQGRFAQCTECHSQATWAVSTFDHDRETDFPLRGAHARLRCASCHKELQKNPRPRPLRFDQLPKTCVGCHGGNL